LGGVVRNEIPPPRIRETSRKVRTAEEILQSPIPRTQLHSSVVGWRQKRLAEHREAQEYLDSRGLCTRPIWKALGVGYADGSFPGMAGERGSPMDLLLREAGFLLESGQEQMRGRVTYPCFAFNQLPVSFYGRAIRDDVVPRHLLQRGQRQGLVNHNV